MFALVCTVLVAMAAEAGGASWPTSAPPADAGRGVAATASHADFDAHGSKARLVFLLDSSTSINTPELGPLPPFDR